MTALLIALLALVLLDIAVIAGWTPDSRDGRDWWWQEWPPRHLRSRVRRIAGVERLVPLLVRPATATEYVTIGALTADVFARERLAGAAYVETLRDAPTSAALQTEDRTLDRDSSSSPTLSICGRRTRRPTRRTREYDAVGELTVAAYRGDGFLSGDIDYVGSLRDAASRAKHADLLGGGSGRSYPQAHPAGTVTFCRPGSRYAELSVDGEAEFRMLAVDSRYRGRGVGEALVRACADRAATPAADAWCAARGPTCTPRTGSTSGSASSALPSWTGSQSPDFHLLGYALEL